MHTKGKGFMKLPRLSHLCNELSGLRRLAVSASAVAGLSMLTLGSSGCIQDTDCGICDPDNLILESISGVNYQSDKIHILNPTCVGDNCPAPISEGTYFIEKIIPCTETEEAQGSANAEEYCKLSPLVTSSGIEFIFNNLLDPTSIELVRKRPDNPQLFEVYDWKTDVLQVQGPITRYNGDYKKGERDAADTITRLVNLSCIDNLSENGDDFTFADYKDPATNPCNALNPATGKPMKLFEGGTIKAARGIWTAGGNSCSSPDEGPDTCCTYCDYLLSTKIRRYGVDSGGVPLNPNPGIPGFAAAYTCGGPDDAGANIDKFAECSEFVTFVDRSDEEQTWVYEWWTDESCPELGEWSGWREEPGDNDQCATSVQEFKLPLFDKLRETHPDKRPSKFEKTDAKCSSTPQCGDVHDLDGTECIGRHADTGHACLADAYDDGTCIEASCRPQWMVTCRYDETTLGPDTAYCQDRRFGTAGTAACLVANAEIEKADVYGPVGRNGAGLTDCDADGGNCNQRAGGSELAFADWNENNRLSAEEACQGSLYGESQAGNDGFACDPYYQGNLNPKPLYERDQNLPDPTRRCICPNSGSLESNRDSLEEDGCFEAVSRGCYDGDELVAERAGQYAVKFVSRVGGIIYDPAIKGFDWRPADLGGVPRADIENCAENNTDLLIAPLNRHDGWRASDTFTPENFEDFDRAMCSGQEYTITFNEPGTDNPAYVIDKADNTLAGKSQYTFETPQFHVQPESGFPTDNLRIGACDDFSLRFSNKYDASPENLAKLQLYRVTCTGEGADKVCELAAPDLRCDRADPPEGACCEVAPVAGGATCYETEPELDAARESNVCAAPCLTIDIEFQILGQVSVQIDPVEFGQYLEVNQTYRMLAPMAASYEQTAADEGLYKDVFWDACGMPLVASGADRYDYDFTIDNPKCKEDADNDGIPLSCDNADLNFNPDQEDIDDDGVGDAIDLCPAAGGDPGNTADSDNDGIGNECDSCRQTLAQYNANATAAAVPEEMMVRNIPDQSDADNDGIGDVCDNCVVTANCEDYGPDNPYEVASPIAFDDNDLCQADDDGSMIGDVCEGQMINAWAGGNVGFGNQDDFDQDGLINSLDGCPRQPLPDQPPIDCTNATAEADCGVGVPCSPAGFCNHIDSDGDSVGNACDTCPFAGNPSQAMEGGSQDDDPDGDFVGELCEIGADKGCGERKNARRFGFFPVEALGNCCTTQLVAADEAAVMAVQEADDGRTLSVGDLLLAGTCSLPAEVGEPIDLSTCLPLTAPHPELPNARGADGKLILEIPVRLRENCSEEQEENSECRSLPATLAATPGILEAPPGCEAALEDAGTSALENLLSPLSDVDFSEDRNPVDSLWQNICFLPQVDQDYDGIGDVCDSCPFAFDPSNAEFVDAFGKLWPDDGAACNGDFKPDNICELEEAQSGETGDTDSTGGSSSGGGGAEGGSTGG